jgi:hypothetical protein
MLNIFTCNYYNGYSAIAVIVVNHASCADAGVGACVLHDRLFCMFFINDFIL